MKTLAIKDSVARFVVGIETAIERARAETFFTKEPGTLRWLREQVRPGDVLLDVGANIGLYSLYAAALKPDVLVYAVEPHVPTAASLLRNVALNGWLRRVYVLTCPLTSEAGWRHFGSRGLEAGISDNQFGVDAAGVYSEPKYGASVDDLVFDKLIAQPTLVKIDVDGNEPDVVTGMAYTLSGIRSMQVEINPGRVQYITALLAKAGFVNPLRHDTAYGRAALRAGAKPQSIAYNLIFTRTQEA
jgi:FkbM family methyltransferase